MGKQSRTRTSESVAVAFRGSLLEAGVGEGGDRVVPAPTNVSLVDEEPASLKDAIERKLLSDGATGFTDVVLRASDNSKFPAVRVLLAVRSPYFRARFFSSYCESTELEVALPQVPPVPLKDIIRYAYTDTSQLVLRAKEAILYVKSAAPQEPFDGPIPLPNLDRSVESICGLSVDDIVSLVELITAADYLLINSLTRYATAAVVELLEIVPSLACLVLELTRRNPAVSLAAPELARIAMQKIRDDPVVCLLARYRTSTRASRTVTGKKRPRRNDANAGLVSRLRNRVISALALSAETLREVLSDKELNAHESLLFEVLHFWASDGEYPNWRCEINGDSSRDAKERKCTNGCVYASKHSKRRWAEAKRLTSCVKFDGIAPLLLRDGVDRCGLVSYSTTASAYRKLALQAEIGRKTFDLCRSESKWPNGGKTWMEMSGHDGRNQRLGRSWFRSGFHQWTFRLNIAPTAPTEEDWTWFGVSAVIPDENTFFANKDTGWAYSTGGIPWHEGSEFRGDGSARHGPTVKEGQTLKLLLNLKESGTMSILVGKHGQKSFGLFRGLKSRANQFTPVIYTRKLTSITLLDETHSFD